MIAFFASRLITLCAKFAPQVRHRGKVYRSLARFCRGRVVESKYGVKMLVDDKDRTNQFCVFGTKGYDKVAEEISKLTSGMCFIDVGANAGLFSLLASSKVGTEGLVFAFEPSRESFFVLVDNIAINGCNNILPLMMAVSDITRKQPFTVDSSGHSGKNRISVASEVRSGMVVAVNPSIHFSALAELIGDRRTIIKIDVEGFERQALEGLRGFIQRAHIVSVIVEIDESNLHRYTSAVSDIYQIMENLGFSAKTPQPQECHYDEVFVRT